MAKPFKISMSTKRFDYVARCILILNDMFIFNWKIFFLFEKIIVTITLGLVIGAFFYDLKNDPSGIQNR